MESEVALIQITQFPILCWIEKEQSKESRLDSPTPAHYSSSALGHVTRRVSVSYVSNLYPDLFCFVKKTQIHLPCLSQSPQNL